MAGTSARLVFLTHSVDIERVKRSGRRSQTPYFNVMSYASGDRPTRVGVIVGRRLGGAVLRNRAKRIFRALARQSAAQFVGGRDVLVFPRRDALTISHKTLKAHWTAALRRDGLIKDRSCDAAASP